ncbi:acetate--CoA ligase OS=Lysinibacillus sphaericus OX=1421 GN=acsA_1 PE=4 SV=1 [Lysinibacillus sphaericus]
MAFLVRWLNGATMLIVGGRFSPQAWYQAIEDYSVTVWYSAPTAFRMLMGAGSGMLENYDLSSLRHVLCYLENPLTLK